MQLAIEQAKQCGEDVPVGAIIVKDRKIIGTGFNQRETQMDPLGHAELCAIKQASNKIGSWRLNGCTLICTLEPCPMCAEAIIQTRMDQVIFGAYDIVAGAAGSAFNLFVKRKSLPIPEVIGGILEEECSTLLKQFFQQQRQRQK
jgi:tRNA(adenine34) deaminase